MSSVIKDIDVDVSHDIQQNRSQIEISYDSAAESSNDFGKDVVEHSAAFTHEQLLLNYIGGDDEAFRELVHGLEERLFSFLSKTLGDATAAADAAQEVWIRVAANANSFDANCRFLPWLYRIARNVTFDVMRQRFRKSRLMKEAQQSMIALETSNNFVNQELSGKIQYAIRKLPEEQLEVFLLKEEAGLTFDEIGALVGCGKETAKSRMRYALIKLRSMLYEEGRERGLV